MSRDTAMHDDQIQVIRRVIRRLTSGNLSMAANSKTSCNVYCASFGEYIASLGWILPVFSNFHPFCCLKLVGIQTQTGLVYVIQKHSTWLVSELDPLHGEEGSGHAPTFELSQGRNADLNNSCHWWPMMLWKWFSPGFHMFTVTNC